ncbi:IPExxxVDY family protein [Chryseobacterium indologenes]|uniref:IPExxxVDY family protein n=1 Tax=Chryseobacterium indologenes TaxID=253 RepID=A0A1Z3W503_CHRID|nr:MULTISPECIES: IPExxxVDY family protein [Chryseobacterium]ASE62828.1 IPExxxVDY family protein [Chryseobacterium indologenes]ATN06741.1 IPExxxVDY family protein [Chryseobacterium indologenes]AYY84513.1 IPExxxVDY family protein [Chryseobacterium indologenes]AYZ34271.1 IPExxxVDY family protein [Chryseobacterium indologenes]AZB18529.1 IPExxxVDY family protein [Chryseobacterium indologenes]
MEIQKLYDLDDIEFEDIAIGLVRLAKDIPAHEFFFKINQINNLSFSRKKDLVFHGDYYDYFFPRFEAYHKFSKTCFTFISNKSSESKQKKVQTELFTGEENIKFLLNNQVDVEYILHSSEQFPDFSVILLPENLVFPIQDYTLSSEEELYQIIQYYE